MNKVQQTLLLQRLSGKSRAFDQGIAVKEDKPFRRQGNGVGFIGGGGGNPQKNPR